jgi:hypothetical protein
MNLAETLLWKAAGNRRHHDRKRWVHSVTLLDKNQKVVFRGKTINLSRTGAKLAGFPAKEGLVLDQKVHARFALVPKDRLQPMKSVGMDAAICRVEQHEDDFAVAIKFVQPLPR